MHSSHFVSLTVQLKGWEIYLAEVKGEIPE